MNRYTMSRLFVMLLTVAGFMLASCHRELPVSYPPEYEKPLLFTLDDPQSLVFSTQDKVKTVRTCKMGDTVTVFLPTIYTGAYITKATYKWTSSSAKIGSKTIEQVAPCKQNVLPPKWTFVAPDSVGEYAVFFRASYEYSAATENGTIFGGYPTSSGIHGYQDESSVYGQLIVE